MKTCELTGVLLDYWVAQIEGMLRMCGGTVEEQLGGYAPSTDWAQGGPIIEREKIGIEPCEDKWHAYFNAYMDYSGMEASPRGACAYDAPTVLVAAMRAYVVAKCGSTVPDEVPK